MRKQIQESFRLYPVTCFFISVSVFFSILTWFGSINYILSFLVFDKNMIIEGEIWRLITPIFLHFPSMGIIFAHLFFNMIWLYYFGKPIERFESSKFLFMLIITSAIFSNVAQGVTSYQIFGGFSGVVYALLGYSFIRGNIQKQYGLRVPHNIAYLLIGFMMLSIVGFFGEEIANMAHIFGFLIGLIFALIRFYKMPFF